MTAKSDSDSRAQCRRRDPEEVSGALVNVAQHLGNLKFGVWKKMQEMAQCSEFTVQESH